MFSRVSPPRVPATDLDTGPDLGPRHARGLRWLSLGAAVLFGVLLAVHWANRSGVWSSEPTASSSAIQPSAGQPSASSAPSWI
jgi:hypothetical protein